MKICGLARHGHEPKPRSFRANLPRSSSQPSKKEIKIRKEENKKRHRFYLPQNASFWREPTKTWNPTKRTVSQRLHKLRQLSLSATSPKETFTLLHAQRHVPPSPLATSPTPLHTSPNFSQAQNSNLSITHPTHLKLHNIFPLQW